MDEPRPRRLVRALRWLSPTVTAAAAACVIAGVVESAGDAGDPLRLAASVGLATALAGPILLAVLLVARGLWHGWRPVLLGDGLREPGGASPRLWGWLVYLLVAAVLLAFAVRNAVYILSRATAFKPLSASLLLPVLIVPAALVLVAFSRPAAGVIARVVRWLDARWQRRRGRPLATARAALVTALVLALAAPVIAWFTLVRHRLGYVDTGILLHPAVALAAAAAVHALLGRLRPRRAVVGAIIGVAVAAVAVGAWVRLARPLLLLDIWSRPTVAGEAVDRLFDLNEVRRELSVTGFPPVARPGAPHPDVVLVTFDTVRADRTPLLGGQASMPHLRALGARGAVFEWAFASGNVTRRSLPSLATGASPSRVRGRVSGWALRLDPRHVVVAERFRAAGYETAGFFCCEGFFAAERKLGLSRGMATMVIDRDGNALAAQARAWLVERNLRGAAAPAFVWIHVIEAHNWLEESRELPAATDAQRYDFVLSKVDRMLGVVLSAYDSHAARAPIVAVTADHGEGLGDHGAAYHSSDLYNSQLRVPLVIAGPRVASGRYLEPVGLVDIAPTLLDLAGFEPPGMPEMDGRSLAGLVTGARKDEPDGGLAYAEMVLDRFVSRRQRALVRGRWKIIETGGRVELYDVRADPGERRDLARDPSVPAGVLDRMRAELAARRALDARPAFVTARR